MTIYAVLKSNREYGGEVVGIIESEEPIRRNWVDVTLSDPRPSVGWFYDGSSFSAPSAPSVDVFGVANESITSGGAALQGVNNVYYAPISTEVTLTADIVDDSGNIQTQIDAASLGYPPILKMPVIKFAGGLGGLVVDEVYFNVTLLSGVLTATGTLPSSGDWKLLNERLNASLAAIGANWKVQRSNVTFLA